MSLATMDTVLTREELDHQDDMYIRLLSLCERDFLQAEVGIYFMSSEEDKKRYMQVAPLTDLMARTQQLIRTFQSAETPEPEPPVKRKRGRPRKNQG